MTATQGMAGDYDEHSQYQRAVADTGAARITQCVDAVSLPPGATFVVADYGSSTGGNSMTAMRTAIGAARAHDAQRAVVAVHNDLPTNDWNLLFHNVATSADSYLRLPGPAIVPCASAVSFFEPAAPVGMVHVGMSFSAAHWLREQPTVVVPGGFYFCEATGDARQVLAGAADDDWVTFLRARAPDLAPGGRLLVQMVGTQSTSDGSAPDVTARKLLHAMFEVATGMANDGRLDPDAVRRYLLPVYARTVDEARAPLTRTDSPLHDQFTVIECRTDPVPNPYFRKWEHDGDAQAYATAYAGFVRGFTESSLRDHLFADGTTSDDSAALDEFFDRLTARFAADPGRDRFDDWTLTVVLART